MKKENQIYIMLILSITFIPAAYLFIVVDFIIRIYRRDLAPLKFMKNNIFLLVILICLIIGVSASHYKLISLIYASIMVLCLYSLSISVINGRSISDEKIIRLIYIVSLIVFTIGLIQYLNPEFVMPSKWVDGEEYELSKRIYSTFFNPNVFGFYINIVLIMLCGNMNTKKITTIEGLTFIMGVICLFLTFSRTSWISLLITLTVSGIFFDRKYFIFAFNIGVILFGLDEILNIGRLDPTKVLEDSSIMYRIEIWKACILIIKDNMIRGIGFGTLCKHIPKYSTIVKSNIEHCHNIYLQIATELGIVGVGSMLFLLYRLFNFLKNKFKEKRNKQRWVIVFSIIIMVMIHGLVDSVLLTPQIMMILSIYTGVILSRERIVCLPCSN